MLVRTERQGHIVKIALSILIALLGLSLVAADADARRLGGGIQQDHA